MSFKKASTGKFLKISLLFSFILSSNFIFGLELRYKFKPGLNYVYVGKTFSIVDESFSDSIFQAPNIFSVEYVPKSRETGSLKISVFDGNPINSKGFLTNPISTATIEFGGLGMKEIAPFPEFFPNFPDYCIQAHSKWENKVEIKAGLPSTVQIATFQSFCIQSTEMNLIEIISDSHFKISSDWETEIKFSMEFSEKYGIPIALKGLSTAYSLDRNGRRGTRKIYTHTWLNLLTILDKDFRTSSNTNSVFRLR